MTHLLLGPLLRHVGATDATVWVETDRPCEVEILGYRERTWTVSGHHYALLVIDGLPDGAGTPYQVTLDGELVWPSPGSERPPSRIRTWSRHAAVEIAFGSCRYASAAALLPGHRFDADVLQGYAVRIAATPQREWPHALLMLGDQVYADETSPQTRQRIRERRDITSGAGDQVADFEEYTWLYSESWTDPDVRWLLSTVPTSMIFDDHDVRDDWNTSKAWRRDMQAKPWWAERIIGALSSYWVYQHLGNLSPAELAENTLFQDVRRLDGDAEPLLREFARAADREADGVKVTRWSYRRDFGSVRLLVIDSRSGRILEADERSMLSADEFDWVQAQLPGDYQHLLIGTSLPWLLPRALHDIEAWNEVLADGHRSRLVTGISEKIRRAGDFEHWAAFRRSFERLALMIRDVARGDHAAPGGRAPATVCVLSGDVHHAYVARPDYREELESAVYQLTCSPLHNRVPIPAQLAFRAAWSRLAEHSTRVVLGVIGKVPAPIVEWVRLAGPYFGNDLMTLRLAGRSAELVLEQAGPAEANPKLTEITRMTLS
ncbi:MAG TPA: alkaline phosphatase D family protein [Nakamurella sp.]